ncbi:hypothetical protein FZC83_02320 [Rossellomorea marisflavi]|uniref:Uncharacterized protein n=1 Tax=Rossellomorea marisflavi TaxID=189381 RepID=A0A5D4S3I6_9BACI|nr:hypothetical protein [Rossellomorea marisflavi]TYS56432.1 hypothetical protein FZC83_02320 [Rossellomorea marisflavi]
MSKKIDNITCIRCAKEKEKERNFYNTRSDLYKNLGKIPVCKQCIKLIINYDDMETIYSFLRQFDIKFSIEHWNSAKESKTDTFARYMTMANSFPQFEGCNWNDSVFDMSEVNSGVKTKSKLEKKSSEVSADETISDDLLSKWGENYTPEEIRAFERKYSMLKNNYQEKTAMHTEALLTYIRYRVKEELATSIGDSKSAKEWGTLAKDAATAAKINPSQLSKSDLSDGLDTFGQLVRSVEQAVDIIPILPRFKEQPQDKVDFTIWCYINYIRDLQSLPLATYEEVYAFYNERIKEFESGEDD